MELTDEYNCFNNVGYGKGKLKLRVKGQEEEDFVKSNLKNIGVRLVPHVEEHKRKKYLFF